MIGGLLTLCGCNACDSTLPELPEGTTKLIKGLCATNQLFYVNIDGVGETGPLPSNIVRLFGTECKNKLLITLGSTGPFPADNYIEWPNYSFGFIQPFFLVYNINSITQNYATWNRSITETIETTTGGYARQSDNVILITGGIPIKRKRYEFNLFSATGANNEPDFWSEEYEEKDSCCCGATSSNGPAFDADPCPTKIFGNVTGGISLSERKISGSNYSNFINIYLYYPGKVNNTYNAFTINLANNATNNSKSWTVIVSNGTVTLQSSAGDSVSYSGSLNSICSNLATNHPTWFSSVVLAPNFTYSGANTNAQGTDLPNWSSPAVQRGVNGTSISVPIVFANYETAPSTYRCGFYSLTGISFFAYNFASVAGITPYNQNSNGFQSYLGLKRYAKKSNFIENNENRGLFYTNEYDHWIGFAEGGNTWDTINAVSTHTRTYNTGSFPTGNQNYTLSWYGCYTYNSIDYTPDFGDGECDNGAPNGDDNYCPSDQDWLNAYSYFDFPANEPAGNDCNGDPICCTELPGPPMPGIQQDCCVCGTGFTFTNSFAANFPIATQKLYGEWYLG